MSYFFLLLALVLNAGANILVKISAPKAATIKEVGILGAILQNYALLAALLLFALNVVFYAFALTKLKLSVAYPIMVGGGFLIITLFSWLYFQERITTMQLIGMLAIMLGIIFLTVKV